MNKTTRNTALTALLLATAASAFAAESADLSVKGVIKPAACAPAISGGGVLDFGTIPVKSLSNTDATLLSPKTFTLTINCDAATKVGVTMIDSRSSTKNASAATALGGSLYTFGVGAVNGKNVGAYDMTRNEATPATADGAPADFISSEDGGATWEIPYIGDDWVMPGVSTHGWSVGGTSAPGAFKTIVQSWWVQLAIGKTGDLPSLTQEIPIDGLMTFQVKYL